VWNVALLIDDVKDESISEVLLNIAVLDAKFCNRCIVGLKVSISYLFLILLRLEVDENNAANAVVFDLDNIIDALSDPT